MPVTQRRSNATSEPVSSSHREAAINAAVAAPARKKRAQNKGFLSSWEHAPEHIRDNEFIRRYYRTGYNFRSSLVSIFRIHNETGNIWTHLVGFTIFIFLTTATIHLRPAPLRLGSEAFTTLENRLASLGKRASLYDLVTSADSWQRTARRFSSDRLAILEEKLRSIRQNNLASEISNITESMTASIRRYGASGMAELASIESRVEQRLAAWGSDISAFSSETLKDMENALHDMESALHRAVASALDPQSNWPVSRWPMYVFTAGAMMCLLTSSVCHVFGCCAAHIAAVMWRFDYAGIALLIVASFFPPVYYGFLCKPVLRATYLIITTVLGASTLGVTLLDRFQDPAWHPYRAMLFVGLGLWGIVPMSHGLLINLGSTEVLKAIQLDIVMGIIYIAGAAIYATRIPERWKPGAFDVAFHSHQIFHIAVVIAAIVHYKASQVMLEWRDSTGGCMNL